ncbi:aspartate 1-decarboxylase [Micromonospora sp. RTP1Z1]|uniref:aspartate 1-decarboxylase n=1 Tax=Micromonospora sp. RTP1Z1 TaxID=2994043 RepID=UPI0029C93F11|nr:aspartate 1-decarboxylase [Micromonospora sp. RTP1Z1]
MDARRRRQPRDDGIHRCARSGHGGAPVVRREPRAQRSPRSAPARRADRGGPTRRDGERLPTYVIEGPRNSGVIGINGAATRLISPGDLVILIAYALVKESGAHEFKPSVVFVDAENKVVSQGHGAAEVPDGHGLVSGAVLRGAGDRSGD